MAARSGSLTEEEARELFRAMNTPGSSTHNLATARKRRESIMPSSDVQDGDSFLETFDDMLDENFEIAKEAIDRIS